MDFSAKGHDIFRRWYVDGRIYYHKIIDKKSPRKGIKELRYIDPRKIKKVREQRKEKDPKTGLDLVRSIEDFYLYNDKGLDQKSRYNQWNSYHSRFNYLLSFWTSRYA